MALLTVADAEALRIDQVWDLYREHVNSSQVELQGTFAFGRDLVDSAEGCYITLRSGRRILDITGGIGVLNHGHNHPEIIQARRDFERSRRMDVHKAFFSPYTAALSANVASLLPGDLSVSYFPNSGAEAVEGALKMAYKFHGGTRRYVMHADISFHGKLLATGSITGSPEQSFAFPGLEQVDRFTYGDMTSLRAALARHTDAHGSCDVYAVIVEPLQASTVRSLTPEFLLELRSLCTDLGIVLVFDEVYTGWGKTGHLFNFMRVPGLVPDIVTYSKSFGGGQATIAGYTAREPVARQAYDNLQDATLHTSTFNGFGEEVATAITAVNIIVRDGLVERSAAMGERIGPRLLDLQRRHPVIAEVRGSGAFWGLILKSKVADTAARLLGRSSRLGKTGRDPQLADKLLAGIVMDHLYREHGVLTYFGTNRDCPLFVSFPLIAGDEEIDRAVAALDETFSRSVPRLALEFARQRRTGPKALD